MLLSPWRAMQSSCWWSQLWGQFVLRGEEAEVLGATESSKTAESFPPWPSYWNCDLVSGKSLYRKGRTDGTTWQKLSAERERRDTDPCKRWHSVKELFDLGGPYLYCSRDHLISEESWGSFPPIPLISIQISTSPPLDSAVLRGEVSFPFVV